MNNEKSKGMIQSLLQLGFSKDKVVIRSDVILLEDLHLKRIHFEEDDAATFTYKEAHLDICIGTSTHSAETVERCYKNGLNSVFSGHIFPTSSYPNIPPRSKGAIQQTLSILISIYTIGDINEYSPQKMPPGFKGMYTMLYFNSASLGETKQLRKEWSTHV